MIWKYGVGHAAILWTTYHYLGFFYGLICLTVLVCIIDALLDKLGYQRLIAGDLLLTLEPPNQNHNIGGYFTIKKIKFEEFREQVYSKAILNIRKLSMIQVERFGFKLWKDTSPQLAINQIKVSNVSIQTEEQCLEYLSSLLNENMDYSKPLWEFHFIENYTSECSLIIVRTHHSFTDAIGFASMMSCMNDEQFIHKIDKKFPEINILQKLILIIMTPFYIFYAMIVTAGYSSDPNITLMNSVIENLEEIPINQKQSQGEKFIRNKFYISEKFEFEDIRKCYKKIENATFHDYMLGILGKCIAKWGNLNGQNNLRSLKMWFPVNMRPLPTDMKSVKLNNYLTSLLHQLKIGVGIKECIEESKKSMRVFNNFKSLTCLSYFHKILPFFPEALTRNLFSNFFDGVHMMFSNIPFPSSAFHICNREVTDLALFANYFYSCRTNFVAVTYKNQLRFMIMADRRLKIDPQKLIDIVVEELKEQIQQSKTS